MKLFSKILFLVCSAGMACSAGVIEFHNCPYGYDEDGNSILQFEKGVSENDPVKVTGIKFGPRMESGVFDEESEEYSYPYDTSYESGDDMGYEEGGDVWVDEEGDEWYEEEGDSFYEAEPSIMVLETFTLLNVHTENSTPVNLWGLVLDSSGTVLATSAMIDFSGSGPVTFDFTADEPRLDMTSVYTITFVLTETDQKQLAYGVNDIVDGKGDSLYVSSSAVVYDQLHDDEGQPMYDEETGEPILDTENPVKYTANENLDYIYANPDEVVELAPAVYVKGYTIAVPEPTTAVMSLLALCGLAARRRRA